jgi:hypothetical protein
MPRPLPQQLMPPPMLRTPPPPTLLLRLIPAHAMAAPATVMAVDQGNEHAK